MKTHTLTIVALLAALISPAVAKKDKKKPEPARPQVEVCFVLDTTGSMSGLIAGAKQKIWSIANDLTNADPSPDLKIGLVGYRDRTDDYITKKFALTDDLDAVYEDLMGFSAAGGGDGPESVNQGLHEAVNDMKWSADKDTLKIIFLVGDYPPHMDYANDIKYPVTCKAAVKNDIIINAVQCGTHGPTTTIWKEIAHLSEGTYAAIQQEGGMAAIASPVDARIAEITREINGTVIAYGDAKAQTFARSKLAAADAAEAPASAARQAYFSKKFAGKAISGREDLVAEVADGEVELDKVKADDLPEEFKKMSKDELTAAVKERQEKRTKLQKEMSKLVAQRGAHVKKELAKQKAEGKESGFDAEIRRAVKTQGAKKGIDYKE
jgi:hypothetical protein